MWIYLVLAVFAVLALDQLLRHLERRGWIYYRRAPGRGSAATGNALLELQSILDPGSRHVLEAREERAEEADPGGEPPDDPEQDEP